MRERERSPAYAKSLQIEAGATGLEPATSGVTGRRSNQLNYAPGRDSLARCGETAAVVPDDDEAGGGDANPLVSDLHLWRSSGSRVTLKRQIAFMFPWM